MKICKTNKVATHTSVASSFGLFDIEKGEFMYDKLALLGIDKSFLPGVTADSVIIGKCREIPVSVPLGDNQASFLGSVNNNQDSILVNIGTGSQISAVSEGFEPTSDIEIRPFIEGKYLACGSALCGGFAYSMVETFFRNYMVSAGMQDVTQYKIINQLALDAYENGEKGLDVDVSFFGKRSDPSKRGSIKMIDRENFTPSALVLGVLRGMCNELYELYEGFEEKKMFLPQLLMSAEAAKAAFEVIKSHMAGSGNTAKRGPIVIATVHGDIHDIGKNIVKLLLENYGFDVIDLGKDVPTKAVVDAVVSHHAPLVGLSALMTTTVPAMEETVRRLKALPSPPAVVVGGAVVSPG